MTVVYPYGANLYLNITNRCPVACVFCLRGPYDYQLAGYDLRLNLEPDFREILEDVERWTGTGADFGEIVFCGMGEPLTRPEAVLEVSKELKKKGAVVRVDTCGLGNLEHGRDLTAELAEAVDAISISLNAGNAEDYAAVCPSKYGREAFGALLEFIDLSKKRFRRVMLSVVHPDAYARQGLDCPVDLDECRRLADSMGLPLKIRGR